MESIYDKISNEKFLLHIQELINSVEIKEFNLLVSDVH